MARTIKVSQFHGPLDKNKTQPRRLNQALSAKFNSRLTQAIDMFDATTPEAAGNQPNHSQSIELNQILTSKTSRSLPQLIYA
jgi:hypothetical protein